MLKFNGLIPVAVTDLVDHCIIVVSDNLLLAGCVLFATFILEIYVSVVNCK